MSYTAEGYKENLTKEETIKGIDILRTALGTMVMFPIEHTDETTFKKVVTGNVQRPILEGESRTKALNKLDKLIELL